MENTANGIMDKKTKISAIFFKGLSSTGFRHTSNINNKGMRNIR
jgi:hypothetical protein